MVSGAKEVLKEFRKTLKTFLNVVSVGFKFTSLNIQHSFGMCFEYASHCFDVFVKISVLSFYLQPEQEDESPPANPPTIKTQEEDPSKNIAPSRQEVSATSTPSASHTSSNKTKDIPTSQQCASTQAEDLHSNQTNVASSRSRNSESDNNELEAHEKPVSREASAINMTTGGIISEAEDISRSRSHDSSPINDINNSEGTSSSTDQPLQMNIVAGMESVSDNNGSDSVYTSSGTTKNNSVNMQNELDTREQSCQGASSETKTSTDKTTSDNANGFETSCTSSDTVKEKNMSANGQSDLKTTNVQNGHGVSSEIENPTVEAASENENERTIEISMRHPEYNKHWYKGPKPGDSIHPLESNAEIDETSTQTNVNGSEQNKKPYKSNVSSVGNEPNNTVEIFEQAFEDNRDVARRNFVKYAENGNQFAFDKGAPPPFKAHDSVKISLETASHDNSHDTNRRALPVNDELPEKLQENNAESIQAIEQECGAMSKEDPVPQGTLGEPKVEDPKSNTNSKSTEAKREETNLTRNLTMPSMADFFHIAVNFSSNFGNTSWQT